MISLENGNIIYKNTNLESNDIGDNMFLLENSQANMTAFDINLNVSSNMFSLGNTDIGIINTNIESNRVDEDTLGKLFSLDEVNKCKYFIQHYWY